MAEELSMDQAFIKKLNDILKVNFENEKFGVKELTLEVGMSRSQLHRKLQSIEGKSVSRFIRHYRLKKAMEMLRNNVATASEIAYRVGFSSPTYFNTCFRVYYGYPPGEAKFRNHDLEISPDQSQHKEAKNEQRLSKRRIRALFLFGIVITIGIFLVINSGSKDKTKGHIANTRIEEKSIAVLPFEDMSINKDQESFTSAMVVEINNHLVKIEDLLVTSRGSTLTYQASSKPIGEIAKELGVATILVGTVQKQGETVRVTVQLVDGNSDKFLWSETYEGLTDSIFAFQSNIAQRVAHELRAQISPEVKQRIYKTPTQNMKAYSLYLQVDYNKTLDENIKLLSEAIRLDPSFADAYVEMAIEKLWRITVVRLYQPENLQEYLAESENLLKEGLELDPDNARAHLFLGAFNLWFNWDFEKAEAYFQNAMRLNPGLPYSTYTEFLLASGRFEEALQNSFQFIRANPNDSYAWSTQGLCYSYLNNQQKVSESIRIIEEKSELHPYAYGRLFHLLNFKEKYDQVISNYEKLSDHPKTFPQFISLAAIAYGHSGKQKQVDEILEKLKLQSIESPVGSPAYYTAMIYAQTEETDLAFEWLEKGYQDHEIDMHWLKVEPFFKPLYGDPRWREMLDKVGFTTSVETVP